MIWRAWAGYLLPLLAFRYASSIPRQARSLMVVRSERQKAYWRRLMLLALRSSAFRCLVHFCVTAVTAVMMWLASIGSFLLVVAVIVRGSVAGDHDRRLAAVGVLDPRAGHVQEQGDRLGPTGRLLLQEPVQGLPEPAQLAEGVEDARRPVHAGDEAAALGPGAPAERRLDHPGDAVRLAEHLLVTEALGLAADRLEPLGDVAL